MAFLPNSSSSQQHHLISNPLGTHGPDFDPVHPPGVPLYSAPMQQIHENVHPYGYLPGSVPVWLPVQNNAPSAFDPNSMQPVQIVEHQQYSGSNNSGFAHLGFLHPQQSMDTHGQQVPYFYGGGSPTQYTMSGPACPIPLYAPPPRGRQHKAPRILAWCELCRVDCNTLENLEKHKQGKKHKKHMKVFNDVQSNNKALAGAAEDTTLLSQPFIPQLKLTEKAGEEEEEVPVVLNEVQKQPDYNGAHPPTSIKKAKKRKKSSCIELRAAAEQPNGTDAWECKTCSITCNSQVVFDTHLAGRRHLTNLVRLHGRHSTTVNVFNSGEPVAQRAASMVNLQGEDAVRVRNLNPPWKKFKRQKQFKPRFHRYNHSSTIQKSQQPPPVNISGTETPEKGEEEYPKMAQVMETNAPEIEPTFGERLDQCSNEESHPSTALTTDEKHLLLKTDQPSACIPSDKSSLQSMPEEGVELMMNL